MRLQTAADTAHYTQDCRHGIQKMQRHTAFLVLLTLLGFAEHCTGQTAGFSFYRNLRYAPTTPAIAAAGAANVEACAAACKGLCGCNGFNFLPGPPTECVPVRRVVPLEPPPGFESTRPVAHRPNAGYRDSNILAVRGKLFNSCFPPIF